MHWLLGWRQAQPVLLHMHMLKYRQHMQEQHGSSTMQRTTPSAQSALSTQLNRMSSSLI